MNAAIINDINYCKYVKPTQLAVSMGSAGELHAFSAADTPRYFRKATILGKKSLDGTSNVGAVHIGASGAEDEQPYTVNAGDEIILEAPVGAKWDLRDWSGVADENSDGLVIIYS